MLLCNKNIMFCDYQGVYYKRPGGNEGGQQDQQFSVRSSISLMSVLLIPATFHTTVIIMGWRFRVAQSTEIKTIGGFPPLFHKIAMDNIDTGKYENGALT